MTKEKTLEILKPILIDFDSLKVGDTLWSIEIGNCECKDILQTDKYAIIVANNEISLKSYTVKGYHHINDNYPSLFKCNPFEWLANQNNQERVIEVWNGSNWLQRVLHMVKHDIAICWGNAKTIEESKNQTTFSYWPTWRELPQTMSISKEEALKMLAEKGVDISNLIIE